MDPASFTVPQLKELAKQMQVPKYYQMRKAELTEALYGSENETQYQAVGLTTPELKEIAASLKLKISNRRVILIRNIIQELTARMCRCVKKIGIGMGMVEESRAIAMCRKSVLHTKNLEINTFSCLKPNNSPKILRKY